jgi:hypothetical protein
MEDTIVFDALNEAIVYAFKVEQTTLLNLDRICGVLSLPHLHLKNRAESPIPCSTITRRRISSTLSSSDIFCRAGPPRTCLWSIRSQHALFLSDAAIAASIEQLLSIHGPLALNQLACLTDLSGVDMGLFEHFFDARPDSYACADDGTWWFTEKKRPIRADYESMGQALLRAFTEFPNGATVEDLHWLLCLSTVGGNKAITRRRVSRELSRRTDLFVHVSRAKYIPLRTKDPRPPAAKVAPVGLPACPQVPKKIEREIPQQEIHPTITQEDEEFNAFSFFTGDFQFTCE